MARRGFHVIELIVVIVIILVLMALVFPAQWLVEIPATLALGWVKYLWRVVPKLNPDPWTVGTAVLCLVGVVVGSHFFLRWVAGGESPWPWKRTLRCVGMVVLMFVAGIAVVGAIHQTSWLVRSPEPLTKGGDIGARAMSSNNLKQICLGFHNFESEHSKELPRSVFNSAGQPMHSWQTAILPYIEQDALHKQIDFAKPWNHPANAGPLGTRIKIFLNPAIRDEPVNSFGVSHYAGNPAVVLGDAKKFDSFPQGISNTILAGEVSSNFAAWGDPLNARDPRAFGAPNHRPPLFVMLDGSVRTFDAKELAELMEKVPE